MSKPDFNLLITLDVLLKEGSVAGAAKSLQLSPSAMSRALARLRDTTGDPLLVRAGRGLVPTPRALQLREQVSLLVEATTATLSPTEKPDLKRLNRTFNLRTREGFVENFGLGLISRIQKKAPGIKLCFTQKLDKDSSHLREGNVDLEIGVVGKATSPELKLQALFEDQFIGVVREGHPLAQNQISVTDYANAKHIMVSRQGHNRGPVDDALKAAALERNVEVIVGGFSTALALVRNSDLIGTIPRQYTRNLRLGLVSFPLPVEIPGFTISQFWHPRMDVDPVHRWMRSLVREVCREHLDRR